MLRFAQFYSPDSHHTIDQVKFAKRGVVSMPGKADGYWTMLHADDVAPAVVAALDAPAGIYNVAEDEPMTRREGRRDSRFVARQEEVAPRSCRQGWPMLSTTSAAGVEQKIQGGDGLGAAGAVPARGLAADPEGVGDDLSLDSCPARNQRGRPAAPCSLAARIAAGFYDTFPGGGLHWIDINGPYNEHFLRDFGALNAALARRAALRVLEADAVARASRRPRAVVYALPHVIYHLGHLDVYESSDKIPAVAPACSSVIADLCSAQKPSP